MSRKSIAEYVAEKRRVYAKSGSAKRTRMIDEVCETLGYTRKYVIKLLTGNIRYRERKGRGKTYGDSVLANVRKLWEAVGCPCTTYFAAELPRIAREYEACIALIRPREDRESILAMSASTLDRAFRGLPRIKPFAARSNRRSGLNRPILDAIERKSGEETMACDVPPGDVQVDTFALGGGDPSENFFRILDGTDRKTQWTVLSPTWNRGQHATLEALKRIERKFPFPISSLHGDNGSEIINYHIAAFLGKNRPGIYLSRSRPRHCNDNAHVEEKNRSVGRQLFGERRIDCHDLLDDLIRLCEEWSDFCNFFRPCKMLVDKVKRGDGKGYSCKYDKPRTPYRRVLDEHAPPPESEASLTAYRNSLHPIELRHRLEKRLRRIIRRQEEYTQSKRSHDKVVLESALPDSSLRDAPPGTSDTGALQVGGISLLPKPQSKRKQHHQSTQYLTNRKVPAYLQGTRSI